MNIYSKYAHLRWVILFTLSIGFLGFLLPSAFADDRLTIVDANVPVKVWNKDNLFDGDLATNWNNDGILTNAWFEVELDITSEITQLRLAPRIGMTYMFYVYVDGGYVGVYTTANTASVELQTFVLPAGTVGTVVRVVSSGVDSSYNHNWFKVHEVELWRTLGSVPVNDDFADAVQISGAGYDISWGSNIGATHEPGEPIHASVSNSGSVWWRWIAPINGEFFFHTWHSHWDTVLAVYTGNAVDSLKEIAANHNYDVYGELYSAVRFVATAGTEYWIAVDGYADNMGTIGLAWHFRSSELPIIDANVPVKVWNKDNLFDSDYVTSWNNDGNIVNAWFEVVLDEYSSIVRLRLAPRIEKAYGFNVYVDGGFVGQYTTMRNDYLGFGEFFTLPAGVEGTVVRVESISHSWFKVHEISLFGKTLGGGQPLIIVDADVPVRVWNKDNLFDGDLATSWNNDGKIANAWFDVILDEYSDITQLRLAPRIGKAYTFNVYVDGELVGQYTTASTSSVVLQTFELPAGTEGTVVRVESISHNWFKVHEVELW